MKSLSPRWRGLLGRFGSLTFCATTFFWCEPPTRTANDIAPRSSSECVAPERPTLYSTSDESTQFEGVITATRGRASLRLDRATCFVVANDNRYLDTIELSSPPANVPALTGHRVLVRGHVREDRGHVRLEVVASSPII